MTLPLLSDSSIASCSSLSHCLAVCSSRARSLNSRSLPSIWMLPAMIRKSLLERIRVHLGDGGLDNLEVQDALGLRICLGFVVGELSILQNKVALLKLSTGIIIVPASPPGIGGSSYTGTLTSLRWPSKPPSKSCPSQPPSKSCPLLRYDSLQSSLSCRKVHQAWR